MTHADLEWDFRVWWQAQHLNGRIYVNRTGMARAGGYGPLLAYGIPAPIPSRNGKRRGGGGSDLFAFPADPREPIIVKYEVKTLAKPTLDPNQIAAARQFEAMGVEVWIVKELPEEVGGLPWELVRFEDYI